MKFALLGDISDKGAAVALVMALLGGTLRRFTLTLTDV